MENMFVFSSNDDEHAKCLFDEVVLANTEIHTGRWVAGGYLTTTLIQVAWSTLNHVREYQSHKTNHPFRN